MKLRMTSGVRVAAMTGLLCIAISACGQGASPSLAPGTRSATSARDTMYADTTAGKSRCSANGHERPFVIDWDATDISSFEAHARTDVVFVHYEGCELRVLDGCVVDAARGTFGSYRPIDWTSGSVESLAIDNEADLYAKLPLGVTSLGGRVHGGERLRMEYFVSGTRRATREHAYSAELSAERACRDATHFVYAYNLGAFTLGAKTEMKGEASLGVGGVGLGASRSAAQRAEKSGGLLATCRGTSAKEVETCATPIRLTLRPVDEGANPDASSATLPETPSAKSLAGRLEQQSDRDRRATALILQARQKFVSRDGRSCLADLDAHDKLDPRPGGLSTNPTSNIANMRAECMMLAGHCAAGRELSRKATEKMLGEDATSQVLDMRVGIQASSFCPSADLSRTEVVSRAVRELRAAAQSQRDAAYCHARVKLLRDLLPTIPRLNASGFMDMAYIEVGGAISNAGPACLARAGDCAAARVLFRNAAEAAYKEHYGGQAAPYVPTEQSFLVVAPSCKDK